MFSIQHSPSSYQGEESILRRRAEQEERLGVANQDPEPTSPSYLGDDSDRGRRPVRGGRSRMSIASESESRLSPTQEDSDEERTIIIQPEEVLYGDEEEGTTVISESTPLIPGSSSSGHSSDNPYDRKVMKGELNILLKYTLPICGTHFLEYSLLIVTVVSVGHIGTVELAASSLGSMTANVVALSVIQGFCAALDTLCTQSYAARPKDTSLHALRTFVILLCMIIPQAIIFWNAEAILLLMRQDPRVAERAGVYLKILSFSLPGYAGFECCRRYLQAQGLMSACTVTLLVTAPVNALLNYLLVWGPDFCRLGFVGAPLATAISMNLMFVVAVLWTYFFAPRTAWGGFTWDIFTGLWPNIYFGIIGSFQIQTEWLGWEVVALASSYLGPVALAAQSILLTSASLFYQIPYALAVASAVRTGNLLGAQRPAQARTSSRVTLGLAAVIAVVNSGLLLLCRNVWGKLFSSEEDVILLVANILPLVAFFQLTDALSGATGGLLRGAGKSVFGAIINLAAYYIIGLPLGFALTFMKSINLGLYGLWLGLSAALIVSSVCSTIVVWKLPYEAISKSIAKSMSERS